MQLLRVLVVLCECPEFFQPIKLTGFAVPDSFGLKILVKLGSKFRLQSIAEETEQTLQPVSAKENAQT